MFSASLIYKCSSISCILCQKHVVYMSKLYSSSVFFFLPLLILIHYRKNCFDQVLITSLSVFLHLQKYKCSTLSMWLWLVFVIQVSMFHVNCSLSILLKLDFWRNRHQNQEYSKDGKIQESLEIGDLVSNDETVATAAENPSINTVWFVYVIEVNCVDHSSNNTDDYGHNVPKLQVSK